MPGPSSHYVANAAFRWLAIFFFAGICSVVVALFVLAIAPQLPPQGAPSYGEPSAELLSRFDALVASQGRCTLCSPVAPYRAVQSSAALDWQSAAQLAQWLLAQPADAPDAGYDARYDRALRLCTIGNELAMLGSIDDAQLTLTAAIAICEQMRQQPADDTELTRFDELTAKAAVRLGSMYAYTGKWPRGEHAYQAAISAGQRLLDRQPANDERRSALAAAWAALGDLYSLRDRPVQAKEAYRQAEPLLLALADRHPETLACHTMLASASAGSAQLADSQEQAISLLRESVNRLKAVAASFPDESAPALLLVQQSSDLLGLLLGQDRYAEAAAAAQQCISLVDDAHTRFPSAATKDQYRLTLRRALLIYALCPVEELRDPAGAMRTAKALAQLDPTSSFRHTAMALALNAKGDWQAAIEAATRANNEHSDPANLFCLAIAYNHLGDSKTARETYDSAVKLLENVDDELALDVYQLQRREAARVLGLEV